MKIACLVAFLAATMLFLCPQAFAIETGVCAPALCRGAQALQFEVGYDFKLSPFQGATLSYERFLRDRLSMRVGIGASMDYQDDGRVLDFAGVGEGHGNVDLTDWSHQYSLVCQIVSYRPGRVGLYYGVGPKVTYSNYRSEDVYGYGYSDGIYIYQSVDWQRTFGVGVSGVVGVQWLVNDHFRLHGEYGSSFMVKHQDDTSIYVRSTNEYEARRETNERRIVGLSSDGTRLGLSVSF